MSTTLDPVVVTGSNAAVGGDIFRALMGKPYTPSPRATPINDTLSQSDFDRLMNRQFTPRGGNVRVAAEPLKPVVVSNQRMRLKAPRSPSVSAHPNALQGVMTSSSIADLIVMRMSVNKNRKAAERSKRVAQNRANSKQSPLLAPQPATQPRPATVSNVKIDPVVVTGQNPWTNIGELSWPQSASRMLGLKQGPSASGGGPKNPSPWYKKGKPTSSPSTADPNRRGPLTRRQDDPLDFPKPKTKTQPQRQKETPAKDECVKYKKRPECPARGYKLKATSWRKVPCQ